ncbi:hypothetical protein EF384_03050 [Aerococcus agrisoli]|uniref:Uncharacterized protein n=1 Tax=Aerococcus agrisoli TaxID=2487350 RepID=A0A3N4GKA3_9LACT|nr:hypothetical protein EF384_03050 [Aerococcus agrisoli]
MYNECKRFQFLTKKNNLQHSNFQYGHYTKKRKRLQPLFLKGSEEIHKFNQVQHFIAESDILSSIANFDLCDRKLATSPKSHNFSRNIVYFYAFFVRIKIKQ